MNNNHSRQKLEELMHLEKKVSIYVFLAAICLSKLFVAAHRLSIVLLCRLLTAVDSLVAEVALEHTGFSSCSTQAQ